MSGYPVEFSKIQKGTAWTVRELEKIVGMKSGTDKYNLAVMKFAEAVEKALKARGEVVFVRKVRKKMEVVTDKDAVGYGHGRYESGSRQAGVAHRKSSHIDCSNLNQTEQQQHHRQEGLRAMELSALRKARKKAKKQGLIA